MYSERNELTRRPVREEKKSFSTVPGTRKKYQTTKSLQIPCWCRWLNLYVFLCSFIRSLSIEKYFSRHSISYFSFRETRKKNFGTYPLSKNKEECAHKITRPVKTIQWTLSIWIPEVVGRDPSIARIRQARSTPKKNVKNLHNWLEDFAESSDNFCWCKWENHPRHLRRAFVFFLWKLRLAKAAMATTAVRLPRPQCRVVLDHSNGALQDLPPLLNSKWSLPTLWSVIHDSSWFVIWRIVSPRSSSTMLSEGALKWWCDQAHLVCLSEQYIESHYLYWITNAPGYPSLSRWRGLQVAFPFWWKSIICILELSKLNW